jgi:SagB-type dehydrogenase family enzyme
VPQQAGNSSQKLLKRSACLVFFFEKEGLCCTNYLTGKKVVSTPIAIAVLNELDRWRSYERIEHLFSGYSASSVRSTLEQLLQHTLLIEKGSAQEKREADLELWNAWEMEARFFHFATKRAFESGAPLLEEAKLTRTLLRRGPQPKLVKTYRHVARIALPSPVVHPQSEFPCVLLERRTFRTFGRGHVSMQQLSVLLWLTWGVTGRLPWPGLRKLLLKTSPSGGARHPIECYCWSLRVTDLPRAIYHYRGDTHELEELRRGCQAARIVKLCAGQQWVGDCTALFVMTAVLPRVMWRYHFSRAYRTVLLEAGHFCQTFCLVATWLGLAPFCTAALVDREIEKDLDLDGATETVLYAAGVGVKGECGSDQVD